MGVNLMPHITCRAWVHGFRVGKNIPVESTAAIHKLITSRRSSSMVRASESAPLRPWSVVGVRLYLPLKSYCAKGMISLGTATDHLARKAYGLYSGLALRRVNIYIIHLFIFSIDR